MTFLMQPQKEGRVIYFLLTIAPSFLLQRMIGGSTGALVFLAVAGVLGYFLVLRKNHTIEVGDISLLEKDWRGNTKLILPGKIHSWRKNVLNELLLLDENSKTLLCVEPNMSYRKQLEAWLNAHHINKIEKE